MPGRRFPGETTPKNREVVRVGYLEQTLEAFTHEMGHRTGYVLDKLVFPRLRRLERLPWNRLGLWIWDQWDRVAAFVGRQMTKVRARTPRWMWWSGRLHDTSGQREPTDDGDPDDRAQ